MTRDINQHSKSTQFQMKDWNEISFPNPNTINSYSRNEQVEAILEVYIDIYEPILEIYFDLRACCPK